MKRLKIASHRKGSQIKQAASRVAQNLYARAYVYLNSSTVDFDPEFYISQYPDIAAAGIDPYRHFVFYGRREGRVGESPRLESADQILALDPRKETIIVVSHEASRTGAPVLSLNLVMAFKQKYNVITMLLGGGELEDEFAVEGTVVIKSPGLRHSLDHARLLIDKISALKAIRFAIINSIESRVVLKALASNFIPTVTLIHEFPAYIRPKSAFVEAMFWSTSTVFSSSVIHQSALREFPHLSESPVHILPQGRCDITFAGKARKSDDEVEQALRDHFKLLKKGGKQIILGAGMIQLRKGVDLFIDCATKMLENGGLDDLHFVWIGKGYDPEGDIEYSAYLRDQVLRAGLENHVTFMPETTAINVAYMEAAAVLITSRLDPLPNVAIDAMCLGVPVLCFDKTTGVVDFLANSGLADLCVARYLDVTDLAAKVRYLLMDESAMERVSSAVRRESASVFSMPLYIEALDAIAQASVVKATQEKKDFELIESAGVYRHDFIPRYLKSPSPTETIRTYLRAWASAIEKRKLFPGFHPGAFVEQSPAYNGGDPLSAYLQAGQPVGPWKYEVITPNSAAPDAPKKLRVALHVHVYYADLFEQILIGLDRNQMRPDLFLSAPNDRVKADLQLLCLKYTGKIASIEVVPNVGRDIGPFLTAFEHRHIDEYDVVGHLHTKKSKAVNNADVGKVWYAFLVDNLIGTNAPMGDIILSHFEANPKLGLVYPEDPHIVGWDANIPHAEALRARLGIGLLPHNISFPVGTMFWARTDSLKQFKEAQFRWEDYPEEPLPYDGSMLHALERLFPIVVQNAGYDVALTNIENVTR